MDNNQVITKHQKIQIHTLLGRYGKVRGETVSSEEKAVLVGRFTSGRATSTTAMLRAEADRMIRILQSKLNNQGSENRMRRHIIAMAHEMGWEKISPVTLSEEGTPGAQLRAGNIDMQRINSWCIQYGKFHKPLNGHNSEELQILVSQFKRVYQSYLKAIKTNFR